MNVSNIIIFMNFLQDFILFTDMEKNNNKKITIYNCNVIEINLIRNFIISPQNVCLCNVRRFLFFFRCYIVCVSFSLFKTITNEINSIRRKSNQKV